jgi:hypothetical protein
MYLQLDKKKSKQNRLTWNSVIVKRHSGQVRVDIFVFIPPLEEALVLHIFYIGANITCKFIGDARLNRKECCYIVKDILLRGGLLWNFRPWNGGNVVSKTIIAVILVTSKFFRCRNPVGRPASAVEVLELVAGV